MRMESYDTAWNKFESLVEENKSCSDCMIELIETLKPEMSKSTYEKLQRLDYHTEVNQVKEHILLELKNKPLPEIIRGIWFGITQYSDENKNIDYYTFYFSGSKNYDFESNEWAETFDYVPNSDMFLLETMNEIGSLIKEDSKFYELGDWIFPISYYSFIINQCFSDKEFKKSFITKKEQIGIAIGYDSGDFINLKIAR